VKTIIGSEKGSLVCGWPALVDATRNMQQQPRLSMAVQLTSRRCPASDR